MIVRISNFSNVVRLDAHREQPQLGESADDAIGHEQAPARLDVDQELYRSVRVLQGGVGHGRRYSTARAVSTRTRVCREAHAHGRGARWELGD
ncbi:MAG: hypothetical protein RMA76_38210 [Deltaproteobacteria bacterium]|jgi:hypothetical protein